jgi:hypothetical protein
MRSLLRGLAGALLILGLTALTMGPADLAAQAKKDTKDPKAAPPKVDPKKDEARDKTVGISTSDGLSLNAYWFQGQALEKNPPDAVLMFPAPGDKVNDAWIGLAQELSKKNFSVLLLDWRGCGMNSSATAGQRIFADKDVFWREPYNDRILKPHATFENKGLDYKTIVKMTDGTLRYRDFLFNDLSAARFYLDRQNDNGKCNSGRIWIVTEKDGGPTGLAYIASEMGVNRMYDPRPNVGNTQFQFRSGGKDFVGLTVLSYATGNPSAGPVFRNAMNELSGKPLGREAQDHLEHRLAMVMIHGKKEGAGNSRSAFSMVGLGSGGDEDSLKKNFKYLKEIDNSKQAKVVTGIDLIDPMDSFGVQKTIVDSMQGISKVLPTNKDRLDREANKMTLPLRFRAEVMGRR